MCSCAAISATRRWSARCCASTGRARSSTSPPRRTSTARSTGRPRSSKPTSSAPSICSTPRAGGGRRCAPAERAAFRFIHVSTDEVYGSLAATDPAFSETTAYAPNSPYSASKAASDHLVRAYQHTYGLPTLTTNCSNNYGPRQFPEKLIPLMIVNALAGKPLPVYGDGQNVRDWLYVGDHCSAIRAVLAGGRPGETYNIGGNAEMKNVDVVRELCSVLGEERPGRDFASLVTFVTDRPGHDRRYAIDSAKIRHELHWTPAETFASGLRRTIRWYLANPDWLESVATKDYQKWITLQYAIA